MSALLSSLNDKKECIICFEVVDPEDDFKCPSQHCMHTSCMNKYLSINAMGNQAEFRRNKALFRCPHDSCQSMLEPLNLFSKMEKNNRLRWTRLVECLLDESETISTVAQNIRTSLLDMLTLRCPSCSLAVDPDPDACAAVTCLSCGVYYCHCCFQKFASRDRLRDSADCHRHAAEAHHPSPDQETKDAFLPVEVIRSGHQQHRNRKVVHCLRLIIQSPSLAKESSQHNILLAYLLFCHDADYSEHSDIVELWRWALSETVVRPHEFSGSTEKIELSVGEILLKAILANNEEACMQLLSSIPDGAEVLNFVDISSGLPLTAVAATARFSLMAQILLRKGADLNFRQRETGRTLLYVIIETGDLQLLKAALEISPVNVDAPVTTERDHFCPIHVASRYNHGHIVQYLIDKGVDVNKVECELGYSPLHIATVFCHEWTVSVILSCPRVNEYLTGGIGRNALHIAAEKGFSEIVKIIHRKRPSINLDIPESCATGWTALHLAAHYRKPDAVVTLLQLGANPDFQDKQFMYTPLIFAAFSQCSQTTLALIQSGANCLVKDDRNMTVLHICSEYGLAPVVRVLVGSNTGISVDDRSAPSSRSPLHYAVVGRHLEVVEILIDAGADVNLQTSMLETPLLLAVTNGDYNILRILCRHTSIRSSLYLKNVHGLCPLRVAIEQGNSTLLSMILEACENPFDAACQVLDDETGWTPIHFAAAFNKVDCIELLLSVYNVDPYLRGLSNCTAEQVAYAHDSYSVCNYLTAMTSTITMLK